MDLVVDASVAVKWLADEEDSEIAALVSDGVEQLNCPHLLAPEVGSALWRKVVRGEMEEEEAAEGLAELARMPIVWHPDELLVAGAVRLAFAHERSVYDCLYLALAYRLDARLVTADLRFANALAATDAGSMVLRLRDYPEGFAGPPRG